jgi:hypothetical protein
MIMSPPEKTYRQNLTLIFWSDDHKPEMISLGIAVALTALWVMMWVWVSKAELTVHGEGIRRQTAFRATEMNWEEVGETRFTQISAAQQMAWHFGLIGVLAVAFANKGGKSGQRTLALSCPDGRKLTITSNWRDAEDAIRIALQRVIPRLKAETRKLITSGEAARFGDVKLSQQGIAWKDKPPIPLNTLVKCKIEGSNLRVKAEGKWLDNINVNTQKVPNVFILLELIDEMRAGGQTMAPDPLARASS